MSTSNSERVEQARQDLRRLDEKGGENALGPWAPAWSSYVLEQTVDNILSRPGASSRDVFEALWMLADEPQAPLTKPKANFVRDLIALCFVKCKHRGLEQDFHWIEEKLRNGITETQAYIAALQLPEPVSEASRSSILKALEHSDFLSPVQEMLD